MSDEQKTNPQAQAPAASNEMEILKKRADQMSITYAANIGIESLREKVNAAINAAQAQEQSKQETEKRTDPAAEATPVESVYEQQYRELMKLVRIRISCLNPIKANVPGEFVTFVNGVLGKVTKYIPFGEASDNGYHVPQCIVNELQDRKFLQLKETKSRFGTTSVEKRMVNEFSIEILEPLTEEELNELKARQHASGTIE